MQFTKRLREPIMRGEVTCSVRIWQRPRVKVGGLYAMGPGKIEVTSLTPIGLSDITPALARKSGFAGVVDLLKVAKHGPGEKVYLIEFVYIEPSTSNAGGPLNRPSASTRAKRSYSRPAGPAR